MPLHPYDLRCESRVDPLGVDALRPRLSWKLRAAHGMRGQGQTAYRIRVARSVAALAAGRPDLWDSGRVRSGRQLHVEYAGAPLHPGQRCFWNVTVWDAAGTASETSPTATWEAGLLREDRWTAAWIGDGHPLPSSDEGHYDDDPAPLLRTTFFLDRPVRRARLYAAGVGYYEMRLNGSKTSDRVLDPPWTAFDERVLYSTDDVTGRLVPGENVLGAMLGNGWFNPLPLRMWGRINLREHLAIGRPCLRAQLVIEFEDGTVRTVATGPDWQTAPGPVRRNSVYLGERYDARDERPGWDAPGFDDAAWSPALPAERAPSGTLEASPIPPIRVMARLRPTRITEPAPGVYVFDLGQNVAGWARLRVQGASGTTVRMRLGELLHEDGTLNGMTAVAGQIKGLRADGSPRGGPGAPEIAWQENVYVLRGGGPEEYTPRFTFHGFRYVEVTGYPGRPGIDAIEGLRLNTDVEPAGSFACSNPRLNALDRITRWTLLSNLFSVQSDCPGREKFQYGGDIAATSAMAMASFDFSTFYAKAVRDFGDAARDGWLTETAPYVGISAEGYVPDAGPIGWGLAHPLLLEQLYRTYGDRRIVAEGYAAARRWVDLLREHSDGLVIDRCIGDHESLDEKPIALMATAHFWQAASIVARCAALLGHDDDAAEYGRLAGDIRRVLLDRFLEPGTGRFDTGTQAAQATALHLGLVPPEDRDAAVQRMVDAVERDHGGHVATGIFGTRYLLDALSRSGHVDTAYRMVDTPDYPGWVFMLDNGATTVWETWAPSDNVYSQNHPMFGSVVEWFYTSLAGIRAEEDAEGFDRLVIAPDLPEGLEWVDASYQSVRGRIASRWRRLGDRVRLEVEIPVVTWARVRIPTRDPNSVVEGGRSIETVAGDGGAWVTLGSGHYVFEAAAP